MTIMASGAFCRRAFRAMTLGMRTKVDGCGEKRLLRVSGWWRKSDKRMTRGLLYTPRHFASAAHLRVLLDRLFSLFAHGSTLVRGGENGVNDVPYRLEWVRRVLWGEQVLVGRGGFENCGWAKAKDWSSKDEEEEEEKVEDARKAD